MKFEDNAYFFDINNIHAKDLFTKGKKKQKKINKNILCYII